MAGKKRFKHGEVVQDDGQILCYGIEDIRTHKIYNVVGEGIYDVSEKELIDLLNNQEEELMDLRADNTRFKLVVGDIIKDLEKLAKSKEPIIISLEYVDWIKENVDVDFYKIDRDRRGF
jgi:hypothetical protein